ncbi:MAG: HNH endonuclease [Saccharofermentanales bacterium]
MPRRPKRPCSYPNCPELTDSRFCIEHERQMNARYERYERDPDTHKRYGKEWRRIRKIHLTEHPLCEECQRTGTLTPASEVHHIIPLTKGGTHAEENLMSLCTSCHSRITTTGGGSWKRGSV